MSDNRIDNELEELETDLFLEAVRRAYGYDFRDYQLAPFVLYICSKRLSTSSREVVGRVLVVWACLETALSGLADCLVAQIRGIDPGPVVQAFLLEQDGERIYILTIGTAGMPDPHKRIRSQQRNKPGPDSKIEAGIRKHRSC